MKLYWGDIHNHNEVGVGKGSMERSYAIARGSLDFYAFTPHGWWPDISDSDPKIRDYHLAGFARVKDAWDRVVEEANAGCVDGSFVSLIAYEWHSSGWGDYCVYFPGDRGELYYAEDIKDLGRFVSRQGALMMPHHCAYRQGWRGTNWSWFDSSLSPTAEIFSEHGNSLEPDSHFGMVRHSMGGSSRSQTVLAQLRRGAVVGFTAGTDDHFGFPGCHGEGLTGLYADGLTRKSVIDAIRRRHTYGVSGDRIELALSTPEGMMGDVLTADAERMFRIDVAAKAEIDTVQLLKNGHPAAVWPGLPADGSLPAGEQAVARIEWGWDGMMSGDVTEWDIEVEIEGGEIVSAEPCFSGGPQVVDRLNTLAREGRGSCAIRSFTCRSNFEPTHAVVLTLRVGADAKIRIRARGRWGERGFERELGASAAELKGSDVSVDVAPVFSAPKIKIHQLLPEAAVRMSMDYEDRAAGGSRSAGSAADAHGGPAAADWYLAKVLQRNGHMAWSSPIWFGP